MFVKAGWIKTVGLLTIAVFIHFFSRDPQRVEQYYSSTFYKDISNFQRAILGWIPFSVGDIIYIVAIIYIVFRVLRRVGILRRRYREISIRHIFHKSGSYINTFLLLYIIFNIVWGLNYNRTPVAEKIGLKLQSYTAVELEEVTCLLIDKVNHFRLKLPAKNPSTHKLYTKVHNAYKNASLKYPFMEMKNHSAKSSLFSVIGSYAGFTGYYNPFTGEAQVCVDYPKFLLPYTASHEVAHQLGFAKENEANFVGYLAAVNYNDPLLKYSVSNTLSSIPSNSFTKSSASYPKDFNLSFIALDSLIAS